MEFGFWSVVPAADYRVGLLSPKTCFVSLLLGILCDSWSCAAAISSAASTKLSIALFTFESNGNTVVLISFLS